ncbi:MAG: hypothetical protein RR527_04595 [Clostridia bacterium]
MNGFTKREKTLLLILLVFGTLALFTAYVLVPQMGELKQMRMDLLDAQYEFDKQQLEFANQQTVQQQLDQADAEAVELYGELHGKKTYDTGLMLSDMLARHSLVPINLTIGERTRSALMDTVDETGKPVEVDTQFAYCREVSLSFTGQRSDADAFTDEISAFDTRYVLHGLTLTRSGENTEYTIQLTLYEFDEAGAVEF